MLSAFITGLAGLSLTPDERDFLAHTRPAGVILFARNVATPDQVASLIAACRTAIGTSDILVLVDQEGGRVQRLRPPHWRKLPPAAAYGWLADQNPAQAAITARLASRLIAEDLRTLGFNCNCTPVLDVPVPGAHDIIGDRAYGTTPERVAQLGRAVAEGHLAGGVLPVIKHIPGHGRATADSHLALPVVTASSEELVRSDFEPFRRLADLPVAMTAHVVFTAVDPCAPASTSVIVTRDVIRGAIGFGGLLMSDDLTMRALSGSLRARAEAVIAAGSDLALHCNGNLGEMIEVAGAVPQLLGDAKRRFERALAAISSTQTMDKTQAQAAVALALAATS